MDSIKNYPFQLIFKSFEFLERAQALNYPTALLAKDLRPLQNNGALLEEIYVILYTVDEGDELQYDGPPDQSTYSTLLRRCLHDHQYDYRTGVVTFENPEISKIKLNIWKHEITTQSGVHPDRGDEAAVVKSLHEVMARITDGYQLDSIYFNDEEIFSCFYPEVPKWARIYLPKSKRFHSVHYIDIIEGTEVSVFGLPPCDPGDLSAIRF